MTVRAGGARMSLPAQAVAEVIKQPRLTRMPHGPAELLGVTHLRGVVLPVVSLADILGLEAGEPDRVVVLRRDPPVGLAVESVEALGFSDDASDDAGEGLRLRRGDGASWLDLDEVLAARFSATRERGRTDTRIASDVLPSSAREAERTLAMLGIALAGQAYGLPLEAVVEVAAVPAAIAGLPRTDAVLLGVCDHRGAVLPVLSARGLLGLAETAPSPRERLVVVRLGQERLGLIVDEVTSIVRESADRLGRAPSLFNRGGGEARIDTVLRLTGDRGVLAILTPDRLLADERVGQWLALASASEETAMTQGSLAAQRERFIVIRLGEELYGLPIAAVDEVVRAPDQLTRLPKAPAYVKGVMNLRGKTLPVIDQRARLSAPGKAEGAGRIVVVTVDGLQAGFAVDAVIEILEAGEGDLLPAPELSDPGARLFDRAVRRGGDVILLIDPKALLERAEADLLRDLARTAPASS
nr:chemotaxis protein CheW [Caulobacter hibisci]